MRAFTATENDAGVRLSRFVLRVAPALPQAAMHRAFRKRRIKVNGRRTVADYRIKPGDCIEVYLEDAVFLHKESGRQKPAQNGTAPHRHTAAMPGVNILWEDESIAILYKPAGILSHSDTNGRPGLLEAFTEKLMQNGEYRPEAENTFAPALCNRLDRGTEGLVIAAKRYTALRDMNALLRQDCVEKDYLCICAGQPPEGVHEATLTRNTTTRTTATRLPAKGTHADTEKGGKPSRTGVNVLDTGRQGALSLCRVRLYTGRTHQIRTHLAALGAPVLGDGKYGNAQANARYGVRRQALCAWRLHFAAQLPAESTLGALAGQTFAAEETSILPLWAKLTGRPVPQL